jgi:hypothetical protein
MSKSDKNEVQTKAAGKVNAVRVRHEASDIVFEISGKNKKSHNKVFHAKSPMLCSLVFAAYARGDKLHIEHLAASTDSLFTVVTLRIGAEPAVLKVKAKGKTKPSLVPSASADA